MRGAIGFKRAFQDMTRSAKRKIRRKTRLLYGEPPFFQTREGEAARACERAFLEIRALDETKDKADREISRTSRREQLTAVCALHESTNRRRRAHCNFALFFPI